MTDHGINTREEFDALIKVIRTIPNKQARRNTEHEIRKLFMGTQIPMRQAKEYMADLGLEFGRSADRMLVAKHAKRIMAEDDVTFVKCARSKEFTFERNLYNRGALFNAIRVAAIEKAKVTA